MRDDVPLGVLETVDDFYVCRTCGKLYWEGPKSNNAFDLFSNVFNKDRTRDLAPPRAPCSLDLFFIRLWLPQLHTSHIHA